MHARIETGQGRWQGRQWTAQCVPLLVMAAVLLALMPLVPAQVRVRAATITVNTTADTITGGACSLRGAIGAINTGTAQGSCPTGNVGDTITFALPGGAQTIILTSMLTISQRMTITGPGASLLTVRRDTANASRFRLLAVTNAVTGAGASIGGLTLANGRTADATNLVDALNGGAILNDGVLALTAVTVQNSRTGDALAGNGSNITGARAGAGGGIHNSGTLTLTNSTVSGNVTGAEASYNCCTSNGGGIYNGGTLTLTSSTVSGNTATGGNGGGYGGGINSAGPLTVTNSTVSGNTATIGGGILSFGAGTLASSTVSGNTAVGGGGIYVTGGTLTVTSSTVSGNTATSSGFTGGGGIYIGSGTLALGGSILGGNTASSGGDLFGCTGMFCFGSFSITDNGSNLLVVGGSSGYTFANPTNVAVATTAALRLGPLADNGGPTRTVLPAADSPAVDGGGFGCPGTDQRGLPRPRGLRCDAGSVELQPAPVVALNAASGPPGTTVTFTGAGFVPGLTLQLGGVSIPAAQITVAANGLTFTAPVPAGGTGSVAAIVTNPDGGQAANNFTYTPNGAAQSLTVALQTASVVVGQPATFTVTARDVGGFVATGYIGTVAFTSNDPGATLPVPLTFVAGDMGLKIVTVTFAAAGTRTLTATDTVSSTITGTSAGAAVRLPTPMLSGVRAADGPTAGGANGMTTGGTTVVLFGANLGPGAVVRFDGVIAPPAMRRPDGVPGGALVVIAPAHAMGSVDVTVTNADTQAATLVRAYTYLPPGFVPAPGVRAGAATLGPGTATPQPAPSRRP